MKEENQTNSLISFIRWSLIEWELNKEPLMQQVEELRNATGSGCLV